MRFLLFLSAASLGACAPEDRSTQQEPGDQSPPAEAAPSEPGPSSLPPGPPAPPPPPPSPWGLSPLTPGRIAAELGPGPVCRLSDGGDVLMAATAGGAVVSDGGRIVRLRREAPGANGLSEGGRFVAGALAVEVRPGAELARRDGHVERDSSMTVVRGRYGFSVSHGPRWTCDH